MQSEANQMDDVIMEDDETMVNSNLKGNKAQLQAMFETADFPELEPVESVPGCWKAPTQEESTNELTGEQDKHASDKRMNQGEITIKSTRNKGRSLQLEMLIQSGSCTTQ